MIIKNIFGSLLLVVCCTAWGLNESQAFVAQTGETATVGGVPVPSGADGNPAVGMAWPNPRFVVGNGVESSCITDNLTGLQWSVNADLFGTQTWSSALGVVENMNTIVGSTGYNLCGHTDWRLPNKRELASLMNYGYSSEATWLASVGFTSFKINYWSSTTYAQNTANAWYFSKSGFIAAADKSTSYSVIPVRGGK